MFCEENGLTRHLTAPHTPQQNGVVERRNRTLMEMTRSLLKAMNVPNSMWGEAVRHATYLINTCVAYVKITRPHLKKLDGRSKSVVNLGTEPGSKAYRLYDLETQKVLVSRDVVFDEKKAWDWSGLANQSVGEPGIFKLSYGGFIEDGGGCGDDQNLDHHEEPDQEAINQHEEEAENTINEVDAEEEPPQVLRRSSRTITQPKYLEDYVLLADQEGERLLFTIDGEPENFHEAKDSSEWVEAMDAELDSIERNKTWELPRIQIGIKGENVG